MRTLLLGAALSALALTLLPTRTASAVEVTYDHVHQRTLGNGMTVVVVENHAVPIVTLEISAKNGAFTEPPEYNGLSHLYEHMFFKANATYATQEDYLARVRELGMIFNGTTSTERVNYYFTLQSHRLEEGMRFMADAIRTPRFETSELEREREVVLGEYDRNEANPYWYLFDAMNGLLWHTYGTRKDALGDRDTIGTATVEQMRWMQETYYIPNNMLLVISGAADPEETFAMAEALYGDWAAGPDPFQAYPIPEHPPLEGHVAAVVEQPVGASVIQLAWHGPDTRGDLEATYAADVFSYALSQTGSRFQEALVESGVALGASLSYSTQRYVGPIFLTLQTLPGGEEAAIRAALAEVARFADEDYVTDAQIAAAQTILATDALYDQQSTEALAHTLTYWWCSATIDYFLTYIDELAAVERADMQEYVRTYLHGQPLATVLLSSGEAIASGEWTPERLTTLTEEVAP